MSEPVWSEHGFAAGVGALVGGAVAWMTRGFAAGAKWGELKAEVTALRAELGEVKGTLLALTQRVDGISDKVNQLMGEVRAGQR